MIPLWLLPALNACLNATSAIFLATGYLFIRSKKIIAHLACMVLALITSGLFLASYLYYHFHAGTTRFAGTGWIRPVYFGILLSHTVLAAVIVPLILITVIQAMRRRFDRHAKIARWTLPLWFYVSVTGVLIFSMLYGMPGANGWR